MNGKNTFYGENWINDEQMLPEHLSCQHPKRKEYKDFDICLNCFEQLKKKEAMTFKYEEVLCPDCNGPMVSRTGQYGVFWGCKKYPECKGTRDSQGRSKADRAREKGESYEKDDKDMVNQYSFKRTK